ncbi:hypothetical protein Y032_0001g483 [Ancylostoma ceylanicum]|uniref:Rab-GAP TBC domain-containing protein n=1 Tax=Ancylostoma ceylanicum TaxID=53326 RepID=A0A016W4N7_9BILA|nr:hypothetical protein Y032_0001g483 [Ancylostoma ceylanicum]
MRVNVFSSMTSISDLFKKAQDALSNLRGYNNFLLGKDGDIVFSKNNVCVHDVGAEDEIDNIIHTPGYLTIHCQQDDQIGTTLILQWLPNSTLHKNPSSIRSVSPRSQVRQTAKHCPPSARTQVQDNASTSPDICVEMNGDVITVSAVQDRPTSFLTPTTSDTPFEPIATEALGVPPINVIPNTPAGEQIFNGADHNAPAHDSRSQSSFSTSGADEFSDNEECAESSSCDSSDWDAEEQGQAMINMRSFRESLMEPERFAFEHDLMLTGTSKNEESVAIAAGKVESSSRASSASLFTVNIGKMRSMRLFYSNPECTCGQLVIASPDSHYKILHFHHGGLDKLAELFEQWSAIKAKSVKDGSPSACDDKHFLICQPAVKRNELDPEDGLYETVTWDYWKSYKNADGAVNDSTTIRKAIFFASMEPSLRKEIWPFLLRVYPWQSTLEQRETIRNDLFLEYQNLRRKANKKSQSTSKQHWMGIENTIVKDVVRTDRKNPYYSGEDNPNVETMKNILLNYATAYPHVNYIQGMSDLLAPLLSTIRNEVDTYWCFAGLMQQTVFSSSPKGNEGLMEMNLEYLRELLKLLQPKFFNYLATQKGDALQLMFVHRWILLFFKREFPESDALHIWEACWAQYRTCFFHLFVCCAIVSIYGDDVIAQHLPHDEILLYFSSLAMHMDGSLVLKKARGLLHEFTRREKIPCSLAGLSTGEVEQWDTHRLRQQFECNRYHGDEPCPFAA